MRIVGSPRLDFPIRRGDVGAIDVGNRSRTAIAHHKLQLALQNFDDAIDTHLTEGSEPPQEWPAHTDSLGAERESFEYIRTPAKSSIHENRNSIAGLSN